jgi:hypothetical protein
MRPGGVATAAPRRDRYSSLDRLLLVITRTMTTKTTLKAVIAPSTHAPDVTPCTPTRPLRNGQRERLRHDVPSAAFTEVAPLGRLPTPTVVVFADDRSRLPLDGLSVQ